MKPGPDRTIDKSRSSTMKKVILAITLLGGAISAAAQASPPPTPTPAPSAQTAPAPPATISAVVDREVSNYERNMTNAAEAMPEDKFNFTPASLNIPGAAFKDVRTFALLIKHTASANFFF